MAFGSLSQLVTSPPPCRAATSPGAVTSSRQQAAARADEIWMRGGLSIRHRSSANGHRLLKEQAPAAGWPAPAGPLEPVGVPAPPGLPASRRAAAAFRRAAPRVSGAGAELTRS